MYKVHVSIPAAATNVGPGFDVLGLALNLRTVIEMSLRPDDKLNVILQGEGADQLPDNYHHPVVRAAIRLFQRTEQAPAGLNVRCTSYIPLDVGLGSRAALTVGGLVAANNLLGSPFNHDDLIHMGTDLTGQPEAVVAVMRGGLGICSSGPDGLIYRSVEVAPVRVVIALPTLPGYSRRLRADLPQAIPLSDAVFNIGRTALLIEALRSGDYKLLGHAIQDRLHEPYRRDSIPGYNDAIAAAEEAGAHAVALCGAGPALLAFASYNHQSIEGAIKSAFQAAGVEARTWSISSDMQGVVISVVE
ncbi:MAG: homoserine kinase [Chloroflexi bacterium]|nr:homoserine kinase [Chloroflexota bacterium]